MADPRQPFRFRLPWGLPPAPAPTPAPAPAPARPVAEPRPPRQPVAAPSRPPFRPAGVAPTQPSPRAEPPQPTPASATPRAATQTQPRGTAASSSPSRVVTPPKIEQSSSSAPKPDSPQKTEPPPEPLAATEPQTGTLEPTSPSKTGSPSIVSTTKEAITTTSRPISPPKLVRRSPSPLSPGAASKPSSPSPSAARSKPSTPYSSSPASPREKVSTKPQHSPKREPSPSPKYPDQSSSTKKDPQATIASENASEPGNERQLQARTVSHEVASQPLLDPVQKSGSSTPPGHNESREMKRALDEPIIKQNGEPKNREVTQLPEPDFGPNPETAEHPVAVPQRQSREEVFHRKEVITTSGAGKKPAETFIPSYPKVGRPHHHKPAGEKAPLQKEIKEDISKFVHKLGVGQGKQSLDGEKQMTVITLAGENRGASMTLSNEARKKESSIRIHRGYRANPDEGVETSTDGEESSKGKGKLSDSNTNEETATKAYINSNVQGINNSLLFNGSVSTMNPGVQYVRSHTLPETSKEKHQAASYETLKAECSATPSEKLAYAPNVRRRCLGGLLLESSDSDAENPEKPRRHGCRYGSKDKNKEKNIGVL